MTKQTVAIWAMLMVLTILVGLLSHMTAPYVTTLILLLAGIKFYGVAFYFMDMKKSNVLWKAVILSYIIIFFGIIIIVRCV